MNQDIHESGIETIFVHHYNSVHIVYITMSGVKHHSLYKFDVSYTSAECRDMQ